MVSARGILTLGVIFMEGLVAAGCTSNDGTTSQIGRVSEAQIPVDGRPATVTELTFTLASGSVAFRTIATNGATVSSYRADTEYWYTRTPSLEPSLTLASSAGRFSAAELDDFHADSARAFAWTQVITPSAWTARQYDPTPGRIATLFKAVDPDDARSYIGMLVEQSAGHALTRVVWFKTRDTGVIFATTPVSLSFERVLDACGKPSTDPRDIEDTTWYRVASP
jgi:hypothetical protein